MDILVVKIHNSVDKFFKEKERKSIMECTQMWWRCNKDKRNEIKYIIGVKDEIIYSAFEVIGFKDVEESDNKTRIGRTIFTCGKSLDNFIGAKVKNSKNRSPLKYYSSETFFEGLEINEAKGKEIMNYYINRGILYR